MALVPKGAFSGKQIQPKQPDRLVNEKAAEKIHPLADTNARLVRDLQGLRKEKQDLKQDLADAQAKIKTVVALEAKLLSAEKRLQEVPGLIDERRTRRLAIYTKLLTGFAANGQLYGNAVKAENVENVIKHAAGVAIRAEDYAFIAGF